MLILLKISLRSISVYISTFKQEQKVLRYKIIVEYVFSWDKNDWYFFKWSIKIINRNVYRLNYSKNNMILALSYLLIYALYSLINNY